MEQKVFSKLNLYDQVGYLLVGAVALLVIIFNAEFFYKASMSSFDLNLTLVWFVISYFLGHVIQAIANLINEVPLLKFLVLENKKEFTEKETEVLNQARKYFNVEEQNESKLWNLCYTFSLAKDITGHVQIFNANYSLYRGWLITFLLESIFLFIIILIYQYNIQNLGLLLISSFLTFIFYKRSKRFWGYTRNKVLDTFVVAKTLKL